MGASILFLASTAFVLYVLFGYPLLLGFLSRRYTRPIRKGPYEPSVSLILPVANGAQWLRRKLESVLQLEYPREKLEIIVVSDGSTDHTEEIARSFSEQGVRLITQSQAGKATALNKGIAASSGEVLFFNDVRQTLSPDSLRQLVSCLHDQDVAAASGELIIVKGNTLEEQSVGLYWKYEKWIRTRLSRLDSVFGVTGCIYVLRREYAVPLPADVLLDDMYLPLPALLGGKRVIFEPSARAYDFPSSLETEFRRKVRTLAGVYQTIGYFPALLGPGNRMLLHFASHKFARLLLPYAILISLVSGLFLPGVAAKLALVADLLFLGLVAADPLIPQTSPLKKLSAPVRTFAVLMAATFFAAAILFVPAQKLWKPTRIPLPKS